MSSDLVVAGLHKSWGGAVVLDGLDLTVAAGEVIAVLGRSGCGKTTLLRIVAGLESADQGSVSIGGVDVSDQRPAARDIGLVVQQGGTLPHLTVAENIGFALARPRRAPNVVEQVRRAAELAGCSGLLDRLPATLSGGEQQRVALARALVRSPRLVLLDEPLSSLDADERRVLRSTLRTAVVEAGATTVHVTHDQDEAFAIGDRVAVIDEGRIAQVGTADELYESPATLGVATLVGAQRINVFPAGVDRPFVDADEGVVAAIRPSGLRVVDDDAHGAVRGVVAAVEAAEQTATVHVAIGEWSVRVLTARAGRPAVGDHLAVIADPDAWFLFDADSGSALER